MKDLLLLRHAKSSWGDPLLADFDRPLAKRGREATRLLGRWFGANGVAPALVLCSPAARTRETLEAIRPALGPNAEVRFEPKLYLAEAADLLARLRAVEDAVPSVLVVGHNPGMQELALALATVSARAERARMAEKFPTAALAWLRPRARTWSALRPGQTRLVAYLRPADLEDA